LAFPRRLFVLLACYILLGIFHLVYGLMHHNLYALRDAVLFVYVYFTFLLFCFLMEKKIVEWLAVTFVVANIVSIFIGRLVVLNCAPTIWFYQHVLGEIKTFNLALYYIMTLAILGTYCLIFKKHYFLIIVLAFIDVYLLMMLGNRTGWVGLFVLVVYMIAIFKKAFLYALLKFCSIFICISPLMYFFDVKVLRSDQPGFCKEKISSMYYFVVEEVNEVFNISRIGNLKKSAELRKSKTGFLATWSKTKETASSSLDNIKWRIDIWRQSVNFASHSPFWGRGFGSYPIYKIKGRELSMPKRIGPDSGIIPTHNDLVTIFLKMGLIGLFVFLGILVFVFRHAINQFRKISENSVRFALISFLGAFCVWNVMALFFDSIDSPSTSVFLWILIGLLISPVLSEQKNNT